MSRRNARTIMPTLESPKNLARRLANRDSDRQRDLLVVQTHGLHAAQRAIRFRLRLLGLSGPGTSHLHASDRFIVRRLVASLARFVEIRPLARPASTLRADAVCMPREANVTREPYEVEDGEALQLDVAQGERLNVEPAEGGFSMAWTTALPATTMLQRLERLLPESAGAELTVGVADGFEETTEPVSHALGRLTEAVEEPGFWRLDLDDRTLTWERSDTPPFAGGPAPGLMGFIGEVFDANYMAHLIGATATPMIGANVAMLLAQCDSVISATHVPHHALTPA
jgi:hypothetical protein